MRREKLKRKYGRDEAIEYDEDRSNRESWHVEQSAVEHFLTNSVPHHKINSIIDVPVGTGRFFDTYEEMGVDVLGIDVSEEMLKQAEDKVDDSSNIELINADIFQMDIEEINADLVVCMRFLNMIDFKDLSEVLDKFMEVEPKYVILGVRTYDPPTQYITSNRGSRVIRLIIRGLEIIFRQGPRQFFRSISGFLRHEARSLANDKPGTVTHNKTRFLKELDKYGLLIAEKRLVTERDDGCKTYVYLMKHHSTQ